MAKPPENQDVPLTVYFSVSSGNENVNAFTSQPIKNSQSSESLLPPLKLVNSFCALKMDSGPCRAMIVRYYFNILTQECEEFLYGGCNGNQNRFETLEECKEKCAGGYHKFTEGIMSKQRPRFCSLSEDPGICRGYIRRYFFNSRSGQCESFIYGGCLGNLNNFDSLELCKKTCKAEVYLGPSWCLSKADRGFCLANETRYYYNSYYKRCLPFKYSGCGGNENNFTTKGACIKTCQTGFIKKAKPEGGFIKTKKRKEPVKILFVKVPVTKT
ncbi:tissue factor pathway inhibitor-like [Rhynchocyon petersi]